MNRRSLDEHAPRWALGHHQFDLMRIVDRVTYLRRWWLVKTPAGGIALHKMTAPDARPELHDHPFPFISIVLAGGYIERRLDPTMMHVDEHHVVRRINIVRRHDAHSIRALLGPVCWTLLLVGRHRRTWGFWEPDEWHPVGDDPSLWRWTKHDAFDSGHYA